MNAFKSCDWSVSCVSSVLTNQDAYLLCDDLRAVLLPPLDFTITKLNLGLWVARPHMESVILQPGGESRSALHISVILLPGGERSTHNISSENLPFRLYKAAVVMSNCTYSNVCSRSINLVSSCSHVHVRPMNLISMCTYSLVRARPINCDRM